MLNKKRLAILLLSIVLILSMVLVGCSKKEENTAVKEEPKVEAEAPKVEKEEPKAEETPAPGKLEIFSWWTNGGESDGLNAMFEIFKQKYPEIEIINATVAGGAGANAKAVLSTRMQGGEPPDSFQVHGGEELNGSWVAADKMEPLNDIYESEGWMDKFPKSLIDMVSKDGKIYSVPVNVHRGNVLWYNKKIFDDNGLTAPETFEDFFKVADALKAKGITPFGIGTKEGWEATHNLETVLVGTLGAEGYKQLWTGEKSFDSPEVKEAFETFKKMLTYANKDHAARNWQNAAELLKDGKVGMFIMGDWAQGYFTSVGLKPNVDYGYVSAPGNKDVFMVVTDTFGVPKGVKNPESARKWMKVIGSVEGQDAFNPLKGSIPARIDGGNGNYDVYLKDQMANFKTYQLTPSLAHGSAAKESFLIEANKNIVLFVTQLNTDKAVEKLQKAADANLK